MIVSCVWDSYISESNHCLQEGNEYSNMLPSLLSLQGHYGPLAQEKWGKKLICECGLQKKERGCLVKENAHPS